MSDDPTEHVQEEIHHKAAHGDGHGAGAPWIMWAALTAAFLAAFAAVAGAKGSSHLTESMRTLVQENDQWSLFQSKSIKRSEIDTRKMLYEMADAAGKEAAKQQREDDIKKRAEYDTPAEKDNSEEPQGTKGLEAKARRLNELSGAHLHAHETYEKSATMFHIAIAIVAIAVVAKRKEFWFLSMLGGVAGLLYFSSAVMHAPAAEHAAGGHTTATEHVAPGTRSAETAHGEPAAEHH